MANKERELTTLQQQGMFVAKSNELVRHSRFTLTAPQSKLLLYLISKITVNDEPGKVYRFTAAEVCDVFAIDKDSGKNYKDIRRMLDVIDGKRIFVKDGNGGELRLRWIDRYYRNRDTGVFELSFHRDMLPYLYALREHYTQYALENVLTMRTSYGIRLYELLKSYEHMGKDISFGLEELKTKLDAGTYSRYPDFKRRVLDAATADINEMSDIAVSYAAEMRFNRRRIDTIVFSIRKPGTQARLMRQRRKQAALSPEGKRAERARLDAIRKAANPVSNEDEREAKP